MRLDKFLKVSRIIKRRTIAQEVAKHDRITINGKIAKPSSLVKIGDIIVIRFGIKLITVEVLSIKEIVKKEQSELMYKLISETKLTD